MEPNQLAIEYDPPHSGGLTSQAAAHSIKGERRIRLITRVYSFIHSCGRTGATRDEIEQALNMGGNTVRPRVTELLGAGLIIATTATRPTRSGKAAEVLTIAPVPC